MTTLFIKSETVLRMLGLAGLALALSSCQPYSGTAGDLKVSLGSSEFVLVDAPGASCRARKTDLSATDIAALHMNLGNFKIEWDGEAGTILKVIYVKINIVSGNLSNADKPVTIASQELNCVLKGDIAAKPELDPTQNNYEFTDEILVGGLKSTDATNRTSFSGTANVIIYALKKKDGAQDVPIVGRASGRFSFDGIF